METSQFVWKMFCLKRMREASCLIHQKTSEPLPLLRHTDENVEKPFDLDLDLDVFATFNNILFGKNI